ncbi:hypothetical protein HKX48_001839 [Thoreauomyces humboldtii]|nr:hypothetical protein HKX48_001839 [Thoreauomyces humboldtii]
MTSAENGGMSRIGERQAAARLSCSAELGAARLPRPGSSPHSFTSLDTSALRKRVRTKSSSPPLPLVASLPSSPFPPVQITVGKPATKRQRTASRLQTLSSASFPTPLTTPNHSNPSTPAAAHRMLPPDSPWAPILPKAILKTSQMSRAEFMKVLDAHVAADASLGTAKSDNAPGSAELPHGSSSSPLLTRNGAASFMERTPQQVDDASMFIERLEAWLVEVGERVIEGESGAFRQVHEHRPHTFSVQESATLVHGQVELLRNRLHTTHQAESDAYAMFGSLQTLLNEERQEEKRLREENRIVAGVTNRVRELQQRLDELALPKPSSAMERSGEEPSPPGGTIGGKGFRSLQAAIADTTERVARLTALRTQVLRERAEADQRASETLTKALGGSVDLNLCSEAVLRDLMDALEQE